MIKEPYIPSEEVINKLLDFSKGTEYYIAICLGILGLRKGEVAIITSDNIKDNSIVFKELKTGNKRHIEVEQELLNMIISKGYAYKDEKGLDINNYLDSFCRENNTRGFSFIALRKYYMFSQYKNKAIS